MNQSPSPRQVGRTISCTLAAVMAAAFLLTGCPGVQPGDNTNGNTNGGAQVSGEIITVRTNRQISELEPFLSILYSVSNVPSGTMIRAFFVAVTGSSPADYQEVGDRVTISSNVPSGTNRAFNFVPSVAGPGRFRVGLSFSGGSATAIADILSNGVVEVQGRPNPVFIQPTAGVTRVGQGQEVLVSFDAGDPEGNVQWRLFLLGINDAINLPPDQLGEQIAVGSGNAGSATLTTADLPAGDYRLGLSATDSGASIAATVARGDTGLIVTNFNGPVIQVLDSTATMPPTAAFSSPGSANVALFLDEAFVLRFNVTIREPGATGSVDLFYDIDRSAANGFSLIPGATALPASTTSFPFPTDLPQGTYNVGLAVRDGINPTVFVYASGTVTVVRTPSLVVISPNSSLPIPPSVPDEPPHTVQVTWSTNVPPTAGSVDVFARAVAANGQNSGPEIPLLSPTTTSTTSTTFSSDRSGLFRIFVRISFISPSVNTLIASSPQPVRVSSIPRILWLGSLATANPAFEGAIFQGVNFEDNVGTSFAAAGDLDGDNLGEFVIGARYGKPFFVNPTGVGPGEAYLLYGASGISKLKGVFNLNSVGTAGLRGITLTGIPTVANSNETDGLSDITSLPDLDGDELPELAFGFPRTNSASSSSRPLDKAGQFLNGGVVILSSETPLLQDPEGGTPVVALAEVGQRYSSQAVTPNPQLSVEDQLTFQAGDPNANPPTVNACVPGQDGIPETVVGPAIGFNGTLAPSAPDLSGFPLFPPGTPPAPGQCAVRFDSPICIDDSGTVVLDGSIPGSGFYPDDAEVRSPFGARLIGANSGDRFGTSVTFSRAIGTTGPGDLIISSPNRSAAPSEVSGLGGTLAASGVAYLSNASRLWTLPGLELIDELPKPHQYVMGFSSHCGGNSGGPVGALRIAGAAGDRLQNILGIRDYNGDGRNDFIVGAPLANNGQGRAYIAFRREVTIEGDFILNKLELAPGNPERLTGILITTTSTDGLGSSLATGFDFNGDGIEDLVIGSPNANGGVGEVIILFGGSEIISPLGGISVQTLLGTTRNSDGSPVAARIRGNPLDATGRFGFNVANAGDIDGDGFNDLLIAAPNATPRFDPDPTDEIDELTTPGLDLNFDGLKDDVSGPQFRPDGRVDDNDNLTAAGIVYVISGRARLDRVTTCSTSGNACLTDDDCLITETCRLGDVTIGIRALGSSQLPGFMIVGRHAGDRLGGGDAGDTGQGGIAGKSGRGRSFGLGTAGDVDGDGRADILIGSILADPRRDPNTGTGVQNGGEAYLVYGTAAP